jgi:hypothetical protein
MSEIKRNPDHTNSPDFRDQVAVFTPRIVVQVTCGDGTAQVYNVEHDDTPASLEVAQIDAAEHVKAWLIRHLASPAHEWCNRQRAHTRTVDGVQEACFCRWGTDHGGRGPDNPRNCVGIETVPVGSFGHRRKQCDGESK